VGRRLVMKVWNAASTRSRQSRRTGPVSHPSTGASSRGSATTVDKATLAFDELDYAGAARHGRAILLVGYTDNYLEMVKARARSESDAAGRTSAWRRAAGA